MKKAQEAKQSAKSAADVIKISSTIPHTSDRELYAEFLRERVYGSITLMAINIGLLLDVERLTVQHAYVVIITTAIGLWAAGLYAEFVAYRVMNDKNMPRSLLVRTIVSHRGILVSAVPSLIILSLAAFGVIELRTALITDILLAITAMTILIIRSASTSQNNQTTTLIAVAAQALIAACVVGVKLLGD